MNRTNYIVIVIIKQILRAKPKDKLPPVKGRVAVLAGKTDNRLPLLAPRVQRRRDHLNIGLVTTIMMIVMMMMMITIAQGTI